MKTVTVVWVVTVSFTCPAQLLKRNFAFDSPNSIVFGEYIRILGDFLASTIDDYQEPA